MMTEMRYHLISGRDTLAAADKSIRNDAFSLWFQVWSEVYAKSNSGYQLYSDEFTRQNLIGVISIGQDVGAVHLYSFFDLKCLATMRMKYFDFFNEDFWGKLKDRNINKVMTMEFLTVNPKYRRKEFEINIGKVLTQTGGHLFDVAEAEAIIAPARNDLKVSNLAYDLGFTCIVPHTIQRGFDCDLIACFKGDLKDSSEDKVAELGHSLWSRRVVHDSAQGWFDIRGLEQYPRLEAVA